MNIEQARRYEPFFGKWYIEEKLGGGSYGEVYKIKRKDALDGNTYYSALKIISIPRDENELMESRISGGSEEAVQADLDDQLQRLEREIQTMNSLKGKTNIVSYEDHDIVPEKQGSITGYHIFMRMELLEDLRHVQVTSPALLKNKSEVIRLGLDICNALELCHGHQIIHRDIKPGNIMRSKDGDYKLGDFGVARSMDIDSSMTRVGTVSFMAPEVYSGGHYDERADIYSLGMVLYHLMNDNRGPFLAEPSQKVTAEVRQQASERRMSGQPLPFPKNADPYLGAVILQACTFDPNERFQTAAAFRQALKQASAANGQDTVTVTQKSAYSVPPQQTAEYMEPQPDGKSGVKKMLIGVVSGLIVVLVLLIIGLLAVQNGWFSKGDTNSEVIEASQESDGAEQSNGDDESGDAQSDGDQDAENTKDAENTHISGDDEEADHAREVENAPEQKGEDDVIAAAEEEPDEQPSGSDEMIQGDQSEDEIIEYEPDAEITEGVNEYTVADYSNNLNPEEYAYFESGIDEFDFSYPSNLYYACDVSTEPRTDPYGTVVYDINFYATDGSQLIYRLLSRTDSNSSTDMRNDIYASEEGGLQDAFEISKKKNSSRGILTGMTADGLLMYDLFYVSDEYVMQMQVLTPDYEDEQDQLQKSYVTDCLYRLCGFSGTSESVCRSYEEFLAPN